jgi:outer membrane protein assembly factor BamA
MFKYRYLHFLFFIILSLSVQAQNRSHKLQYNVKYEGIENEYVPKQAHMDSLELHRITAGVINKLRRDGYWLCSIDSVSISGDSITMILYQGKRIEKLNVSFSDVSMANDYRIPAWDKIKAPDQITDEIDILLSSMENIGYPFSTIEIRSTSLLEDEFQLELELKSGTKITYDSIKIVPRELLKYSFISKYLELEYGHIYDEQDIKSISSKIDRLPFVDLKSVKTEFQLKMAKIHLDLEERKVNTFDGILGAAPSADGSGIDFTGELDLNVKNLFHSAKELSINWLKPNVGSQQLHASYLHPILLGSPLDFYFGFDQLRQDTSYANRSLQLALDVHPTNNLSARFTYENKLGNELQEGTSRSGNFKINYYGLSLDWHLLDNLFFPKNGIRVKLSSSIGRKEILEDNHPQPQSSQYNMMFKFEGYKKIGRSVAYVSSNNGLLINDYLFLNDLYRIGGLRTIRGFNELEFFGSKYTLINLEWRYYMASDSYLVAFYDQAFISYSIASGSFSDQPGGLGIGMNFSTDSGQFSLLYALGKREGESFSFDSSKLHFGYTAYF